jgi:uncharacterized protein YbjT (DUF2867 family)
VIVVAGGTGRLGALVVRRLRDRGLPVRVLTRDPARAAPLAAGGVQVAVGDVRDRGTLVPALADADVVVSCVQGFAGPGRGSPASVDRDGNANLIDAARAAGAEIVLMSVVGASADSPLELFRMKHAAEQHLHRSGVPATIVRSTAFLELWAELLETTAGRSGRPVVFGRGDNPINFVHVDDVASLVERATTDPTTRGRTLEVAGADLTLNQLAATVQAAAGRSGRPRHVPPTALRLLARTVGLLRPDLSRQARAALLMDRIDLTYDPDRAGPPLIPGVGAPSCERSRPGPDRRADPAGAAPF